MYKITERSRRTDATTFVIGWRKEWIWQMCMVFLLLGSQLRAEIISSWNPYRGVIGKFRLGFPALSRALHSLSDTLNVDKPFYWYCCAAQIRQNVHRIPKQNGNSWRTSSGKWSSLLWRHCNWVDRNDKQQTRDSTYARGEWVIFTGVALLGWFNNFE